MARISLVLPAFLLVTVLGASAQTRPASIEPVPDGAPAPPPRVKSGEPLEPEARTVRQEHETITEYRGQRPSAGGQGRFPTDSPRTGCSTPTETASSAPEGTASSTAAPALSTRQVK